MTSPNNNCKEIVDVVEETVMNETMFCQEADGQECWSSYQTEIDVVKVLT